VIIFLLQPPPLHDLRHLATYSLDPPHNIALDDAISIEPSSQTLWLHIADVARWIPRGSPLDDAASRRLVTLRGGGGGPLHLFPPKLVARMSLCAGDATSAHPNHRGSGAPRGNSRPRPAQSRGGPLATTAAPTDRKRENVSLSRAVGGLAWSVGICTEARHEPGWVKTGNGLYVTVVRSAVAPVCPLDPSTADEIAAQAMTQISSSGVASNSTTSSSSRSSSKITGGDVTQPHGFVTLLTRVLYNMRQSLGTRKAIDARLSGRTDISEETASGLLLRHFVMLAASCVRDYAVGDVPFYIFRSGFFILIFILFPIFINFNLF
jgi:hypothetical protein